MILLKLSFPTPLSPRINTFMSVGATLIAVSKAVVNSGECPIILNLCLIS